MGLTEYRILATYIVVLVAIICTIFYAVGNVGTRDQIEADYKLPSITFNFVFALGDLYFVMICFIYVLFNIDISTIALILPTTVMLVSFVMLYVKLYFSLKTGDVNFTEVQTFAFNIVINSIIIMLYTLFTSKRFISSTLAMFPMLAVGIYYLYIGHLIAKN
jgi:hypothetical protein